MNEGKVIYLRHNTLNHILCDHCQRPLTVMCVVWKGRLLGYYCALTQGWKSSTP
jgi:hypothetical protein